tara:strand:+ start:482 stop:907 length:426 start_codon:yes stop_codon:yes gene_type:complete
MSALDVDLRDVYVLRWKDGHYHGGMRVEVEMVDDDVGREIWKKIPHDTSPTLPQLTPSSSAPSPRSSLAVEGVDHGIIATVTLPATPKGRRPRVRVTCIATGDVRIVCPRVVPLVGAANFRDVGGYITEGGKSVKWGLIYR